MFDREVYEEEQRAYLEANSHIFNFTNPHPQDKSVGDCVKRAICLASGKDYQEVKIELNRHKRMMQVRKRKRPIVDFNDRRNWIPYIENESPNDVHHQVIPENEVIALGL